MSHKSRWSFVLGLIGTGVLTVGSVAAQTGGIVGAPVQPRTVSYSLSDTAFQPQDAVAQEAPPQSVVAPVADSAISSCVDCEPPADEPWTLFGRRHPNSPIKIGGWISAGHHSESNDLFNSHPNGFPLHQAWMYVEKVAESKCGELGWGFRFDGMYGVDGPDTQAFGNTQDGFGNPTGWDNGFDRNAGFGWALPQAYLEFAKNDWSVKVGHFYTLVGYEVVPAPDNFFYSHTITMYNSEPFTHTGFVASYSVNDDTTLYGGWTLGWDTGFDQFDRGSSFLGGFSTPFGQDRTLTYISTVGDFGARGRNAYSHSIVLDRQVTCRLQSVVQSDFLRVNSTGEDNFSVNHRFIYQLGQKTAVGTRAEWWKGDAVTDYAPHGGVQPPNGSQSHYALTTGLNYRPNSNIVLRPEYRYNWSPAVGYDQGVWGVDVVVTF